MLVVPFRYCKTVLHVRMACDPTEIGHAAKAILWMDIEDVFHSHRSTEEEAANSVHDTLGFTSGSGSL